MFRCWRLAIDLPTSVNSGLRTLVQDFQGSELSRWHVTQFWWYKLEYTVHSVQWPKWTNHSTSIHHLGASTSAIHVSVSPKNLWSLYCQQKSTNFQEKLKNPKGYWTINSGMAWSKSERIRLFISIPICRVSLKWVPGLIRWSLCASKIRDPLERIAIILESGIVPQVTMVSMWIMTLGEDTGQGIHVQGVWLHGFFWNIICRSRGRLIYSRDSCTQKK